MSTLVSRSPSRLLQASDVLLLLVAMVWGTSYGVAKEALVFYPVLGFLAVRFCLTFVILLPQLRGEGRQAWAPGIPLGGVMLAIFLCETYGVLHTSASNAAFLISLCVVITPFVEWLMFDRRPTRACCQRWRCRCSAPGCSAAASTCNSTSATA